MVDTFHRCLLWFDHIKAPTLVRASDFFDIWDTSTGLGFAYGVYHPQLITCPVPDGHIGHVPRAVSLQAHGQCHMVEQMPSNVLRVVVPHKPGNRAHRRSIGVCVIALKFATFDMASRLVEFLEMVRLMGADKVHFYVLGVSKNMRRVLQHYQKEVLCL